MSEDAPITKRYRRSRRVPSTFNVPMIDNEDVSTHLARQQQHWNWLTGEEQAVFRASEKKERARKRKRTQRTHQSHIQKQQAQAIDTERHHIQRATMTEAEREQRQAVDTERHHTCFSFHICTKRLLL